MINRTLNLLFIGFLALALFQCKQRPTETPTNSSTNTTNPNKPNTQKPRKKPNQPLPPNTSNSYYVSLEGEDNNSGTKDYPFQTIEKVNSLSLKPGARVYFKGGETFKGTLNLQLKGTLKMPIIITSYESQKKDPIIDGGSKEGILISGTAFALKGLRVNGQGRNTGNTTNGITLSNVFNAFVGNVHVMGFQKSGIEINACQHILLQSVYAYDNGFCGIYVTGSKEKRSKNIVINNSFAESNPGDPSNLTNHSGSGILASWCDSITIDHCSATKNGWDMPRQGNGPVGIWAYESDHVLIQYCVSFHNSTSNGGKDGGGFDLDGGVTNSIIQYCLSYDNEGAGYGLFQYAGASNWRNNIVRYCISINDATSTKGAGSIFVWNGSGDNNQLTNCNIYNNVIYSSHAPAVQFERTSPNKNFLFYNNIFFGNEKIIDGPSSGEHFIANDWWKTDNSEQIKFRTYSNLQDWATATGQEKKDGKIIGSETDPSLNVPEKLSLDNLYILNKLYGLKLPKNSPLKDKGIRIAIPFQYRPLSNDFFGQSPIKGKNPDPGVFEVQDEQPMKKKTL